MIFEPGSTAVMPANDEYVSIKDYLTAIKVMALSIHDWCNSPRLRMVNRAGGGLSRDRRTPPVTGLYQAETEGFC